MGQIFYNGPRYFYKSVFSGEAEEGRGGPQAEDPALRVRAEEHRLPLQRQAARRHDQEAPQSKQGGSGETQS